MEKGILPMNRASIFALLVDPEPYLNQQVQTAGWLFRIHGGTYLVPASSSDYWFTNDSIRVDNSEIPNCLLEQLIGKPTRVFGTLVRTNGRVELKPVHFVRQVLTEADEVW